MITTLCYLEKDNKYLMLHRTKKEKDINKGKWLGIGGKLEKGETPEQCLIREVKEETGYNILNYNFRGIVIFNLNEDEPLYMYLYSCSDFYGEIIKDCTEGELKWIDKKEIKKLNIWEGDKIFLDILSDEKLPFFYLTLNYKDDTLLNYKLEFKDEFSIFEVFVPENFIGKIVEALSKYSLLNEGNYANVYAVSDTVGHWTTLDGANPFKGTIGKESVEKEKIMKFRVKKEFKELAYFLIKQTHPYEVPVINIY